MRVNYVHVLCPELLWEQRFGAELLTENLMQLQCVLTGQMFPPATSSCASVPQTGSSVGLWCQEGEWVMMTVYRGLHLSRLHITSQLRRSLKGRVCVSVSS